MGQKGCLKYGVLCDLLLHCIYALIEGGVITYILLRRLSIGYFLDGFRLSLFVSYIVPAISFLVAVLGVMVVTKKKPALIKLHAVIIGFCIALELSIAIWVFIEYQNVEPEIAEQLENKFSNDTKGMFWWDNLQTKHSCCGIYNSTDYLSIGRPLPASCCCEGNVIAAHSLGCAGKVFDALEEDHIIVFSVFTLSALLKIPCIVAMWRLSTPPPFY